MKYIPKRNFRYRVFLPLLALLALLGIGGTYAWKQWNLSVVNELKSHTTETEITEKFDQGSYTEATKTKEVSFKNTGSSSAFLRMSYEEYWTKQDGTDEIYLSNTVNNKDVAVKNWAGGFTPGSAGRDWWYGGDGWYYYTKVLASQGSTSKVLTSVTFPDYLNPAYTDYKGADYTLYFKSEVVQASDGPGTLNSAEVNADATSTLFGMKATVDGQGNVTWSKPDTN